MFVKIYMFIKNFLFSQKYYIIAKKPYYNSYYDSYSILIIILIQFLLQLNHFFA